MRENSKLPRSEQMKSIVRAPCFDRVGCDRAGASRQVKATTTPETWKPREKISRFVAPCC